MHWIGESSIWCIVMLMNTHLQIGADFCNSIWARKPENGIRDVVCLSNQIQFGLLDSHRGQILFEKLLWNSFRYKVL